MFEEVYTNSWEELDEFPDYVINHLGEIVNIKTNHPLSYSRTKEGIVKANLYKGDRIVTRSVALLMAKTFLTSPNPNYNSVIHLDGDKVNCHISNLALRPRWFVVNYHQQFAIEVFHDRFHKPVICLDTDEVFANIKEACIAKGLLYWELQDAIINKTKIYPGGLMFDYHNTETSI